MEIESDETPATHEEAALAPGAAAPARGKNIVLCSDGTGNSGGKGRDTNVFRMYQALDLRAYEQDAEAPRQVAFYDDGVGTDAWKPLKLFGGAFGWGLSRNIRELYAFLVHNYRPGDRIYLFGFSRGAFTVRSLAGLICTAGIFDPRRALDDGERRELMTAAARFRLLGWLRYHVLSPRRVAGLTQSEIAAAAVKAAFNTYRRQHMRGRPLWPRWLLSALRLGAALIPGLQAESDELERFRQTYSHPDVRVRFIGVWDTVGALGAPMDWMRALLDRFVRISFHKQDLHERVDAGYHALAIDEERETFAPVMWEENEEPKPGRLAVEQVWFAGVHSNVGGGYPKQGLAHVSLSWMMSKARAHGLVLHPSAVDDADRLANVNDKLYDSRAGLASYYRYRPRNIAAYARRYCRNRVKVHCSVFERILTGVYDYAPSNLPAHFEIVDDGPNDARAPWKQRVEAHVRREAQALSRLQAQAWKWISYRRRHYYAALGLSVSLVLGVVELHASPLRSSLAALGLLPRPSAAPGPQLWASLASPKLQGWIETAAVAAVDTLRGLSEWALPSALREALAPLYAYFGVHPLRFVITVSVIVLVFRLNAWLRDKTHAPFVDFWARVRSKLHDERP